MMIIRTRMAQALRRAVFLLGCAWCFSSALAQDATQPPAGQQPVLTVKGDGVQIYSCREANGVVQWVFAGPEAKLLDASGQQVGSHGAGPFWKSLDGSLVKGQLAAKQDAPGAGDIPWLLAKASAHEGSGVLAKVAYIRRSETHGGAAPSGGCDAAHLNANVRVPYTATYTFYAAKP
jgi:Protein of unknown function (DUF3455)